MFAIMPLLAANFMDFAIYIVIFVFMVIGWINQMIVKNREAARKRPAQPVGEPAGAGAQRDEVEEFLRDVIKRRQGGNPPRTRPPRQAEVEWIEPQPEAPRRLVKGRKPGHSSLRENPPQQPKPTPEPRPNPQSNVELADERLASRMHNVFDHHVGSLDAPSAAEEKENLFQQPQLKRQIATSSVTAAGLGAMLSDQRNLKQAIVLMEILKRPEERW